MEANNHFTCIAYDTVDFLIQSKYVVAGVYLDVEKTVRNITFNRETLPHIHIGSLLEEQFLCKPLENYNIVLVMKMHDFARDVRQKIVNFTDTAFPASGYLALSVNSSIASRIIDIGTLRLIPQGIRERQEECGVCAVGFLTDGKVGKLFKKQLLISPDNLLRKFFAVGLLKGK